MSDGRRRLGVAAVGLARVVPLLTRRLLGDDEDWIPPALLLAPIDHAAAFAYHGHIVVTTSSGGDRGQRRWNPAVP